MNRDNRSSSSDQSTRSASGPSSNRSRPDAARDFVNRQPFETPRRYDQPIEDDDDPVMPFDDTKI